MSATARSVRMRLFLIPVLAREHGRQLQDIDAQLLLLGGRPFQSRLITTHMALTDTLLRNVKPYIKDA